MIFFNKNVKNGTSTHGNGNSQNKTDFSYVAWLYIPFPQAFCQMQSVLPQQGHPLKCKHGAPHCVWPDIPYYTAKHYIAHQIEQASHLKMSV